MSARTAMQPDLVSIKSASIRAPFITAPAASA
jgi:hypothetical protein